MSSSTSTTPFFSDVPDGRLETIKEKQERKEALIKQCLLILVIFADQGKELVSTTQLRSLLKKTTPLSDYDKVVTPGDDVTRFERSVRNLISHNDLLKLGLAKSYKKTMKDSLTYLKLTVAGRAFLLDSFLDMLKFPLIADLEKKEPLVTVDLNGAYNKTKEGLLETASLLALAQLQKQSKTGKVSLLLWQRALKKTEVFSVDDVRQLQLGSNFIDTEIFLKSRWIRRFGEDFQLTSRGKAELLKPFMQIIPKPELDGLSVSNRTEDLKKQKIKDNRKLKMS